MIKVYDLFCGAGGSSYGAKKAGAEIVGGIDCCPVATATFADNFSRAKVLTRRLEKVRPQQVMRSVDTVNLLLASPECTNHSCARGARPRSESSRETALQVLRFARAMKPRWLILENVIYMRPWSRYKELLERLQRLGYFVRVQVLNAADFAVPQGRKRLFILCDLEQDPPEVVPTISDSAATHARSILDPPGTWPTQALHREGRAKATLERAARAMDVLGPNTDFLVVYYGSDGAGGWQHLDRPLRTITTLDRFGLVSHGSKSPTLRMLQVPELQRAMGLGNEFQLSRGTRRDKIRLLGNGVCAPVMEAAVRTLTG